MTQQAAARPVPESFHTITPHLVCDGAADAIAFYQNAFGAQELSRLPGPGGKIMHAQMRIGDSILMLADIFPDGGSAGPLARNNTLVYLHLYVDDADAAYARALDAGARSLMPPADMFWGDRYGQVEDPFGHRWSIATHQRDMTPAQMMDAMQKTMGPMGGTDGSGQGCAGAQS